MAKRPTIGGLVKDFAAKLAREAERYVGAEDATMCVCGHERSAHCGCGTVCMCDPTCSCKGFSPESERSGAV